MSAQAAVAAVMTPKSRHARRKPAPALAQHIARACTQESHAAAKASATWADYRFAGYQTIGGASAVILEQRICPLCESGLMVPVKVVATERVAHD
jgi:hypothetical protein